MDICFKNFQGEVTGRLVETTTGTGPNVPDTRALLAGDFYGVIFWYLLGRWPLARQTRPTGR
jgi:hypothetical protein